MRSVSTPKKWFLALVFGGMALVLTHLIEASLLAQHGRNQVPANVIVCDPCSTNPANSRRHDGPFPGGYEGTQTAEGYVRKCIPNEWLAGWPQAALRSAAIAIRTKGMWEIGWYHYAINHNGQTYDAIRRGAQCYWVSNPVNQNVRDAVDATRGVFMSYYTDTNNNAIDARYSQDSGNYTESWPGTGPYLLAVGDQVRNADYNPWATGHLPGQGEAGNGTLANPGGPGEGQYGSAQRAMGTYAWDAYKILSHYYTGVVFQGGTFPNPAYRWSDNTANPNNSNNGQPWIEVPTTMTRGQWYSFTMRLQNLGTMTWQVASTGHPNRVKIAYHWRDQSNNIVIWDGNRSELPDAPSFYNDPSGTWPPGRFNLVTVWVQAPPNPGQYILEFDLVQEFITWFNQQGGWPTIRVNVNVN